MRKSKRLILYVGIVIALMFAVGTANAQTVKAQGTFYMYNVIESGGEGTGTWTLYDDGTLNINGSGTIGDFPSDFGTNYGEDVKKAVFSEGITSTYYNMFYMCYNLEEVVLPQSMTRINYGTFCNCRSLSKINFPSSLNKIESDAFADTALEEVNLSNVTEIGARAFKDCKELKHVVFNSSLKEIKDETFDGCHSLQDIKFPSSIKSIGQRAFRGCWEITSIHIPEGIEVIEEDSFAACTKLTDLYIPSSVKAIKNGAFSVCTSLEYVKLPEGLKEIGSGVFWDTDLKSLNIPSSIEKTGYGIFGSVNYATPFIVTTNETDHDILQGYIYLRRAEISKTSISFNWTMVTSCDAYKVYKLDSYDGKWKLKATITDPYNNYYCEKGLKAGEFCTYRVIYIINGEKHEFDRNELPLITDSGKPAKVKNFKLKKSKTSIKASFSEDPDCDGVVVQIATDKNFTKNVKKYTIKKVSQPVSSKSIKGLKKGKTYYVRVREFNNKNDFYDTEHKVYGSWTKALSIKF